MKKIIFFVTILSVSFSLSKVYSQQTEVKILIKFDMPDSLQIVLARAIFNYVTIYNLSLDSIIVEAEKEDFKIPAGIFQVTDTSKRKAYYRLSARALPGKIILYPQGLKSTCSEFFNTITHEMFHVLRPKDFFHMEQPVWISKYHQLVGYDGLGACTVLEGVTSVLRVIEEAAAEVCAVYANPDYFLDNDKYFRVRNLMFLIIEHKYLSINDLILFQQNNDFLGFIGKTINKDKITPQDIQNCLIAFDTVLNGMDPNTVFLTRIKEHRK